MNLWPSWRAKLQQETAGTPWLVVGKGPSAAHVDKAISDLTALYGLGPYTVALNHAVTVLGACDMWSVVDVDVLATCGPAPAAQYLVMPAIPHERFKPARPVEAYVPLYPVLADYWRRDRLLVYRKVAGSVNSQPQGTIACRYFSAEAVFGLAGELGAKEVYSVGIDGGREYAPAFRDYRPLTNGRATFDDQMPELYRIAAHYGFRWDRLYAKIGA